MDDPKRVLSWAAGKRTVLCVGTTNIDCVAIVNRYPKRNELVASRAGYWQRGGNAANNCTVLRNLGVDVEFFGVLSSREAFRIMEHDMRRRGIKADNCPRLAVTPPFSTVVVNRRTRSTQIVTCQKTQPYPTPDDFRKLDLSRYGWIHFRCRRPDITAEMMRTVEAYNERQPEQPIVISMDMDRGLEEAFPLVSYCDYLFCYRSLAAEMDWKSPRQACNSLDELLRMRFGINLKRPYLVFLWSLQRVGLLDANGDYARPTVYKPLRFVEGLGANEAFVAAFIYAVYVRERSHRLAANFASLIANYKCTNRGFDHICNVLAEPVL